MEALNTQQTAVAHADMTGQLQPGNPLQTNLLASGLSSLNAEITRQAAMVGLIDVFKVMLLLTFAVAPLLLIMRAPKSAPPSGEVVID
jgi:DHA2 family multidrug resistance protein